MEVFIQERLHEILKTTQSINDPWRRKLAIASVITQVFEDNDKQPPVVVGGLVVATYSFGQYVTEDIDRISPYNEFPYQVLKALGYKRYGKDSFNKELNSYVEFPSGDLSGDEGRVLRYDVEETGLHVYVLGVEDIILDRLDAFVATNDGKSKEWVLKLLSGMYPHIDWSYVHNSAHQRGTLKTLEKMQRLVKRYQGVYEKMVEETSVSDAKRMDLF
jgi:uncharacterized protein YqfB (UPF0267 family)